MSKTRVILISILFLGLILLGLSLDTRADNIKKVPMLNPNNVPTTSRPTAPTANTDRDTHQNRPQPSENRTTTTTTTPDIPEDWGQLISSQFLQDGAYLSMTFTDKAGGIRIATFKKSSDGKSIELYNLMVFNRTKKKDLKPVTSQK